MRMCTRSTQKMIQATGVCVYVYTACIKNRRGGDVRCLKAFRTYSAPPQVKLADTGAK